MNQQPDELFRQKLQGFQKPAPATAWEKIAAAQNKKSHKGLWLKIAASLLLLALVIYTRWPEIPANEKVSELVKEATVKPEITTLPPQQDNKTKSVDLQKEPATKQKKSSSAPGTEAKQPSTTNVSDLNSSITESIAMSMQEVDTALSMESSDSSIPEPSYHQAAENITMIFTAQEVDEYLYKKEIKAIPEATDVTKKPSNWKKLLKRANELTNNQDPFGELRQKKNEIFALNFKNEKQRGQNK
jgi:hypothetical protein